MNVLIACEESQEVCKAFRAKGHNAFSCDIQECSGGHPEWHIHGDMFSVLKPAVCQRGSGETFTGHVLNLQNGGTATVEGIWDLIVFHPPCTDLAGSGARWFAEKRADGRQRKSIEFFGECMNAYKFGWCRNIVIENPVGIISGGYIRKWFPDLCEKYGFPIKPTQIIQPYQFGEHARKATCLWIAGPDVKPLEPTDVVDPGKIVGAGFSVGASLDMARDKNGRALRWNDPETAKQRSKTFPGIAKALAGQLG